MKTHTHNQSARNIGHYEQQAALDAWRLWCRLDRLAASLWETYENQFYAFCEEEARDNGYDPPTSVEPDPPF